LIAYERQPSIREIYLLERRDPLDNAIDAQNTEAKPWYELAGQMAHQIDPGGIQAKWRLA